MGECRKWRHTSEPEVGMMVVGPHKQWSNSLRIVVPFHYFSFFSYRFNLPFAFSHRVPVRVVRSYIRFGAICSYEIRRGCYNLLAASRAVLLLRRFVVFPSISERLHAHNLVCPHIRVTLRGLSQISIRNTRGTMPARNYTSTHVFLRASSGALGGIRFAAWCARKFQLALFNFR